MYLALRAAAMIAVVLAFGNARGTLGGPVGDMIAIALLAAVAGQAAVLITQLLRRRTHPDEAPARNSLAIVIAGGVLVTAAAAAYLLK